MAINQGGIVHCTLKNTSQEGVKAIDFVNFLEEAITSLPIETEVCFVMDNARIHHTETVTGLFERFDVDYLYLPPYSPDYNPIELVFGWIKRWIKNREPHDMFVTIQEAVQAISVVTVNQFTAHCWNNWTSDHL